MAEQALTTVGAKFAWAVETTAGTKPTTFKEIEECISVGGIELSADKLDATPLSARIKKYARGVEDTGGELPTKFNYSDTFKAQWEELRTAAATAKTGGKATWFEVYVPDVTDGFFYIVDPGSIPRPQFDVNNVLQVEIKNTLIDLPELSAAVVPSEALVPTAGG